MVKELNINGDTTRTINRKYSMNYQRYKKNQLRSFLQIGSKKEVQKQNASTISQIKNDYLANFIRITDVFHEIASIYTFFEIGSMCTFSSFGPFENTLNGPKRDLRQALYALFSWGKNCSDPWRSNVRKYGKNRKTRIFLAS